MCQSSAPCAKSNVDKKRLLEVLFLKTVVDVSKLLKNVRSTIFNLDIIIFDRVINNAICTDTRNIYKIFLSAAVS